MKHLYLVVLAGLFLASGIDILGRYESATEPAPTSASAAPAKQPKPLPTLTIQEVEARQEVINEDMRSRRQFAQFTGGILEDLYRSRTNLREARERVLVYCLSKYPSFLEHIAEVEQGNSIREKIARNLIRDFRVVMLEKRDELVARLIDQLETELTEILREERQNGTSGTL